MGRLIDADDLKKAIDCNPDIRFIKSGQIDGTWVNARDCLKVIDRASTIDPVHYAGGCYCRECEYCKPHPTSGQCKICTNEQWSDEFHPLVSDNDFCSYGRRRGGENADG